MPGELVLNVGDRAPRRLHGDTDDRAEEYAIRRDGADLLVEAFNRENVFGIPTRISGEGNLRGDILSLAADVDVPVLFTGGDGRDILRGGASDDELHGDAGPDRLNGRSGDDRLFGGDDHDELIAGDGSDVLDGGPGLDTASWSGASVAAVIDLRVPLFSGAAAGDTLVSIERYKGTAHADTIDGSESSDSLLHGEAGEDLLRGHAGDDLLEGGTGGDSLEGGDGHDMLVGGPGADGLEGGAGNDIASYLGAETPVSVSLATGTGTRGDAQGDTLAGIETLMGSGLPKEPGPGLASGDILEGGEGPETFFGMDGSDSLRGGDGDDVLYGNHPDIPGIHRPGFDDDGIHGDGGNDELFGQLGDDTLDGGPGDDKLLGGPGDDHLISLDPAGTDELDGEAGINRLSADYSDKAAALHFTVGEDNSFAFPDGDAFSNFRTVGTLVGGAGDDVIRLAAAEEPSWWNKTIDGGSGDDLVIADWRGFYGLAGGPVRTSDSLAGGEGVDTLSFEQSPAGVTVNLETAATADAAEGIRIAGFENLVGTHSTDSLTGDAGDNVIMPLHGGPHLDLARRNDNIHGGGGIDVLRVDYSGDPRVNEAGISMTANSTTGSEAITLGPNYSPANSTAILYYRSMERLDITGGSARDLITADHLDSYPDRLVGMGGNDELRSYGGDDLLDGGDGDDNLQPGTGHDAVLGGAGDDTISFLHAGNSTSHYGHDICDAGPGDDHVINIRYPGNSGTQATAGTIMQFDGGPGTDLLSVDAGNALAPVVFDEASPGPIDLPGGGYLRNFELLRDVTLGAGDDAITLHGRRTFARRIAMNGGNDRLHAGLGIVQANGGDGEDLLILDYSPGDDANVAGVTRQSATSIFERKRIDGGDVLDRIQASGFERVHFTGTPKNDTFDGFSGDDVLRGGEGDDTFSGSNGNDFIAGGGGTDTLTGDSGNDWLDGGPGADTMRGDQNNDIYIVDHSGDTVAEAYAQYGTDTVRAAVDYALPAFVEHLVLTGNAISGTGNGSGNSIGGNTRDNHLRGENGNDTLDGGGGPGEIDRLHGGTGADTFLLGNAGLRYYDGAEPAPGRDGHAVIEDFAPSQNDRLRLAGAAAEYLLGASPLPSTPGTAIYHDSDGDGILLPANDELIAILQSGEPLDAANILSSASFTLPLSPQAAGMVLPVRPLIPQDGAEPFAVGFSMDTEVPADVRIEVQASADLGSTDPWFTVAGRTGANAWSGSGSVLVTDGEPGRQEVIVSVPPGLAGRARLFMRLRVFAP